MSQVTIPTGPRHALDAERLATLLREAFFAVARDVRDAPVITTPQLVYQAGQKPGVIWQSSLMPYPQYQRSIFDVSENIRRSPEVAAVIDYLWGENARPQTITQEGDAIPGKDAWAQATWVQLLRSPFVQLCSSAAQRTLSLGNPYVPWAVDPNEVDELAKEIAANVCTNTESVTAICPLVHVEVSLDAALEISPNVVLRPWSSVELCEFLTRYRDEFLPNDMSAALFEGALEIRVRGLPEDEDEIAKAVIERVDLAKWALMSASNDEHVITEGPIIRQYPWGWHGQTIRRHDITYASGKLIRISRIDSEVAKKASELAQRALKLMQRSPELGSVLWFFGRSTIAPTSRDAVLESAIGLEALLVPDPGESTYKFTLHGSALLSAFAEGDVECDLKKIYQLRSKAAHGAEVNGNDYAKMAIRARFLLAKAILAAIQLAESGELQLETTKGDLAKATRDMVKRRCTSVRQ